MDQNQYQSAFEAGLNAAEVKTVSGVPFAVLPEKARLESLERYLLSPNRIVATPRFNDANSFSRYVDEFKDPSSRLFARATDAGGEFCCVIDFHAPKSARWCEHRPSYCCPHDEVWKIWGGANGKWMAQRTFAEFIESNMASLVSPPAAQFLEIAQSLSSTASVSFTGSTRLDAARDQIEYQSTTEARAGEKGMFCVPNNFALGLPVFVNGPRFEVRARLRHRVIAEKRTLELCYELINPQLVLRAAWDDAVATVAKATKLEPFMGWPQ